MPTGREVYLVRTRRGIPAETFVLRDGGIWRPAPNRAVPNTSFRFFPRAPQSDEPFVFDWDAFRRELAPLLAASLGDGDPTRLVEFADRHRHSLRDPYEGERLGDDWPGRLEVGDVHEVADFVLTKYYDPTEDRGLGEAWQLVECRLDAEQRQALLGQPFGPEETPFDPGRMGSYFQDGVTARSSLEVIRQVDRPELSGFVSALEQAVTTAKGLYTTF